MGGKPSCSYWSRRRQPKEDGPSERSAAARSQGPAPGQAPPQARPSPPLRAPQPGAASLRAAEPRGLRAAARLAASGCASGCRAPLRLVGGRQRGRVAGASFARWLGNQPAPGARGQDRLQAAAHDAHVPAHGWGAWTRQPPFFLAPPPSPPPPPPPRPALPPVFTLDIQIQRRRLQRSASGCYPIILLQQRHRPCHLFSVPLSRPPSTLSGQRLVGPIESAST